MKNSFMERIKERWKHILLGLFGRVLLKLIGSTCRYEIEGIESFLTTAPQKKCILMFWHNRLIMIAEILARFAPHFKYAALISNSRDGEAIATLTSSYKNGRTIRVPHNARSQALQTLIKEMRADNDVIIITPDGPRGPAFTVKPGIVLAAKKTRAQIFPLSWNSNRKWNLPTWDGLMIPKPFSTITIKLGAPLSLEEGELANPSEGAKILGSALLALEKER